MAQRRRLDSELLRRKLATDLDHADQLIGAHKVRVNGAFADKSERLVDPGDSVELVPERAPFVSRGGVKLAAAFDSFGIDPKGVRCLDAGASTGGFTDCLVQRGAAHVTAVDVGYGQLHESLVRHPRVLNRDRTNIRELPATAAGGSFGLVVGDLSFVSLRSVLEPLVAMGKPDAALVLLVKPQFEASQDEVSRGGGVITDPGIWARVLEEVAAAALRVGAGLCGAIVSPIRGGHGNVEFLIHLVVGVDSNRSDLAALALLADKTPPTSR